MYEEADSKECMKMTILRQKLRNMLTKDPSGLIHVLGAYDAWSARLIEHAGFDAIYMSGFGAAASVAALPDIGLLTMTQMAQHADTMSAAVSIPVIADADNGYGNLNNVRLCVQSYERAGVAALHLEDQVSPKKCGHFAGKEVISRREMAAKIRAAIQARTDEHLMIIARTDANAIEGIEKALERGNAYIDAGADALLIEAPRTLKEIEQISHTFGGKIPLVYNMVESGLLPDVSPQQLERYGFRIVLYSTKLLFSVTRHLCTILATLRDNPTMKLSAISFDEFLCLIRFQDYQNMEHIANLPPSPIS
jgi:2-methylisocitrate lyase-like PEP mutase family enzyme